MRGVDFHAPQEIVAGSTHARPSWRAAAAGARGGGRDSAAPASAAAPEVPFEALLAGWQGDCSCGCGAPLHWPPTDMAEPTSRSTSSDAGMPGDPTPQDALHTVPAQGDDAVRAARPPFVRNPGVHLFDDRDRTPGTWVSRTWRGSGTARVIEMLSEFLKDEAYSTGGARCTAGNTTAHTFMYTTMAAAPAMATVPTSVKSRGPWGVGTIQRYTAHCVGW